MQNRLVAIDDERMTGIVATLKTHHRLGLVSEQVNDLALAFITPVRTNNDYILAHFSVPELLLITCPLQSVQTERPPTCSYP